MKKLIIAWTVCALIFEFGVLFLLDKVILVDSYDFTVNETTNEQDNADDISVTIKEGADNISLSYSGKYIAYNYEESLCVEDTKNGTINKVPTEKNEKIMYYKWIENRNVIAIVETNADGEVQLVTYNPADSSKAFVQTICYYTENMKVKNMATSVLTNVYYIDIARSGLKDLVYRVDRNNDITLIDINTEGLGNIKTIPHEDRLIYEDKVNGKFFVTSPDEELKFNSEKQLSLLGIDKNDVIYMGEVREDKIVSILYGKVSKKTSDWRIKILDQPVKKSDIYFNDDSEILVNNEAENYVENLLTKKETPYEGTFLQMNDEFVASINNDRQLKYTRFDMN